MNAYRLSPAAQTDLIKIRDYYLAEAGYKIARQMLVEFTEAFRFLAHNPGAGHKREDLAEARPVLFWVVRDYYVIYKIPSEPLLIIMIIRASRDLPTIFVRREL